MAGAGVLLLKEKQRNHTSFCSLSPPPRGCALSVVDAHVLAPHAPFPQALGAREHQPSFRRVCARARILCPQLSVARSPSAPTMRPAALLLALALAPLVTAVTTEVPVAREARALITVVPDFK